MKIGLKSIEQYIRTFPEPVQKKLRKLRKEIKSLVPKAEEKISYQMPAFFQNGVIVYFAAFSKHIGLYPTSSGIAAFKSKLSKYKFSKGAIRFPIDEPLPFNLIKRIVKFRVAENTGKRKN
jgi:uncharacterized protein YdhG (YjbR/CyaY superfamily)